MDGPARESRPPTGRDLPRWLSALTRLRPSPATQLPFGPRGRHPCSPPHVPHRAPTYFPSFARPQLRSCRADASRPPTTAARTTASRAVASQLRGKEVSCSYGKYALESLTPRQNPAHSQKTSFGFLSAFQSQATRFRIDDSRNAQLPLPRLASGPEIGSASSRDRVCP